MVAANGLPPFTALTPTDVDAVLAELETVRAGTPVIEHAQFREDVACATALVHRNDPAEPWWSVVVSVRADSLPTRPTVADGVTGKLLAAAADLATG